MGVKSERTRRVFERLLSGNIRKVLTHYGIQYQKIIMRRGRIYLRTLNAVDATQKLVQIFGISSVSPAKNTSSDMNSILNQTLEHAYSTLIRGSSFAVRCHRVGEHTYSSMDVCSRVGEEVLANLKTRNIEVNLEKPQFTINIEIRDDDAYVFSEKIEGVDGFPLGSQPKVICLLSGGIDSPAACWLTMKRGCPIIPIHFDIRPFTDDKVASTVIDVARKLFEWAVGFPRKVYFIPYGKNLKTIKKKSPEKLTCILCKRMMYRIAERMAEKEKAEGVVTGETIGEQASQTLHNLRVLDYAVTKYPVHRPLLCFNKRETEKLAKKIGTFTLSTRTSTGCSAAPKKPTTKAKIKDVEKAERELDIEKMVEESIRKARIVKV
jgi:thiamine biosynthesis protein ThiI